MLHAEKSERMIATFYLNLVSCQKCRAAMCSAASRAKHLAGHSQCKGNAKSKAFNFKDFFLERLEMNNLLGHKPPFRLLLSSWLHEVFTFL